MSILRNALLSPSFRPIPSLCCFTAARDQRELNRNRSYPMSSIAVAVGQVLTGVARLRVRGLARVRSAKVMEDVIEPNRQTIAIAARHWLAVR